MENMLKGAKKKTREDGDDRRTEFDLQQALPIWTPACPTWREMTSRMLVKKEKRENLKRDQGTATGL